MRRPHRHRRCRLTCVTDMDTATRQIVPVHMRVNGSSNMMTTTPECCVFVLMTLYKKKYCTGRRHPQKKTKEKSSWGRQGVCDDDPPRRFTRTMKVSSSDSTCTVEYNQPDPTPLPDLPPRTHTSAQRVGTSKNGKREVVAFFSSLLLQFPFLKRCRRPR